MDALGHQPKAPGLYKMGMRLNNQLFFSQIAHMHQYARVAGPAIKTKNRKAQITTQPEGVASNIFNIFLLSK